MSRSYSAKRIRSRASNRCILALFAFAVVGFSPTAGASDGPLRSQTQKEVVFAQHLKGRILSGKVGKARLSFNESSVTVRINGETPESFEYSRLVLRQGHHHRPVRSYPSRLMWWTIGWSAEAGLAGYLGGPVVGLASFGFWVGIPNAFYFAFSNRPSGPWLNLHSTSAQHRCAFVGLPRQRTIRKALLEEFMLRLGTEVSIPRILRGGSKNHQAIAAVGSPAPDFSLADLNGFPHRLSNYRGRVVLLNFWAPWCRPCRGEPRGIERLPRKYGESNLAVVGMVDEHPDEVQRLLQDQGIGYPILYDNDSATFSRYGVTSLPTSVVIDRNGVIAARVSTTDVTKSVAVASALKVHALHSR